MQNDHDLTNVVKGHCEIHVVISDDQDPQNSVCHTFHLVPGSPLRELFEVQEIFEKAYFENCSENETRKWQK